MGSKQFRWVLLIAVLAFGGTAQADTVYVNGSYAFASGAYGIPPYGGTLNGQAASFYCVDFAHDITGGTSWDVTTASLAGSDFSSTRLSSTLGSGTQTAYLAMAYLVTQMMGITGMDPGSQLQDAEDQFAIWSFSGGPDPYGTNSAIIAAALAAVQATGFSGAGFEILTPTGSYGQEFIINTPEPGVLLLLVTGLAFVMFFRNRTLLAHK
jgi:hypothetical protein